MRLRDAVRILRSVNRTNETLETLIRSEVEIASALLSLLQYTRSAYFQYPADFAALVQQIPDLVQVLIGVVQEEGGAQLASLRARIMWLLGLAEPSYIEGE